MEESEERVENKEEIDLRCKKVQITVSTTSKEQKHTHRYEFCFLKIYGFYGFCCYLETEQLFL